MSSKNAIAETVQFKKPLGVASKKPLKSRSKTQQQQPFSAQQKERVIKLLLQQSSPSPSPLAPSLSNINTTSTPSSSTSTTGVSSSSTLLTNVQPLSAGSGSLWNAQNSQNAIPRKFSFVNFVEVSSHDPIHSINEEIECRTKQMQELTNTIYFATLQYYCDFLVHLRNRLHVFTTMTKANALRFDSPATTLTQFSQESLYLIPSANTQAKHLAISFIDSSFQSLSGYIHSIIHSSFSAAAHSILLRLVSDASSELASRPPSSSSSSSSEPVPPA